MNVQPLRNGIIEYFHADYGISPNASFKFQLWRGMCGNIAYARSTGMERTNFNGTRRGVGFSTVGENGFRVALPFMKNSVCEVSIYAHIFNATNDGSVRSLLMLGSDANDPVKALQLRHGNSAGNLSVLAEANSASISNASAYADTELVLGATRSVSSIALYANGASLGTQAITYSTPYQGAVILLIGHHLASGLFSEPFLGSIRRIAIYGVAHTATEAAAISAEWLNK